MERIGARFSASAMWEYLDYFKEEDGEEDHVEKYVGDGTDHELNGSDASLAGVLRSATVSLWIASMTSWLGVCSLSKVFTPTMRVL